MATETQSAHYKDWPNAAGFNALQDHRAPISLQVQGEIPDYAIGVLYRTGPGGYKTGDDSTAVSHWFDGYTVVHRFEILRHPNGAANVTYSSYCQVDELLERVRKTGRREEITFGQKRDPCDGLFKKFKTSFTSTARPEPGPHAANIGVAFRDTIPSELHQLHEAGINTTNRRIMTVTTDTDKVKQFDADTLEPLGIASQQHLHPSLSGPLSGAHAVTDLDTGAIFNYNLTLGPKAVYKIFKASPSSGEVEVLATVSGPDIKGAYLHSIMLSQNFVIVCIWPAHFKLAGLSILWNQNILDAIQAFDPKAKAIWLVVDRRNGRGLVKKLHSPAMFCFHTINAWETPSTTTNAVDITCELSEYDNMDILHWFYYKNMVSDEVSADAFHEARRRRMTGGLARYKLAEIPLQGMPEPSIASKVATHPAQKVSRVNFPDGGDLPRINPHYVLKPHRYVWTVIDRHQSSFVDGLAKTDIQDGSCLIWDHPKHTPSEPIFVPKPGSLIEDEGVVLTVVLDGERGTSYLLCLDAQTMKEVGRADIGHPVGLGFHGTFKATESRI